VRVACSTLLILFSFLVCTIGDETDGIDLTGVGTSVKYPTKK
jgi:hypothetical protein